MVLEASERSPGHPVSMLCGWFGLVGRWECWGARWSWCPFDSGRFLTPDFSNPIRLSARKEVCGRQGGVMGRWGEVDTCVEVVWEASGVSGWPSERLWGRSLTLPVVCIPDRSRSSDLHLTTFFVNTLVGWSRKSKNSPDLGHFKISPWRNRDPC